jgi:hypothetical protein
VHVSNFCQEYARPDLAVAKIVMTTALGEMEQSSIGRSKTCWLYGDWLAPSQDLEDETLPALGCRTPPVSTNDSLDLLATMPVDFLARFLNDYGSEMGNPELKDTPQSNMF